MTRPTHSTPLARVALTLAVIGCLVLSPAVVSAATWTSIASGTTTNITAVDELSPSTIVAGTASGQLLKNGVVKSTNPGVSITDVAFNPAGTVGIATAASGRLLRSIDSGEHWSTVALTDTSYAQPLPCADAPTGSAPKTYTPTGTLNAVSWAGDTVAYVVAADQGVVLKTTDGGASWNDVSRQGDNTCRVDTGGDELTDVKALPGSSVVWLVDSFFGTRYRSDDGLSSMAVRHAEDSAVNCFNKRPQLALDLDNPNRAFMTDRCAGSLAFGFTEDGGTHWTIAQDYAGGNGNDLSGLNDVAIAGGAALAVGNGGAILVDGDGHRATFQRADGVNAGTDWFAVDKLDAGHAVIGGAAGALLVTDQAGTVTTATPQPTPDGTPSPTVLPPAKTAPTISLPPAAAITRAVPRFRPRFGIRTRGGRGDPLGLLSLVGGFSGVPDGGRVEVRCVRACSRTVSFVVRRSGRTKRTSTRFDPALRLTSRTLIDVRVSAGGLFGRFARYKFRRGSGVVLGYRITSGCLTARVPLKRAQCP